MFFTCEMTCEIFVWAIARKARVKVITKKNKKTTTTTTINYNNSGKEDNKTKN